MSDAKPKLAFWFRYGPAEHAELFHAIPRIVEELARHAEVHYFGMRTATPIPSSITDHALVHHAPFSVDRANPRDKWIKTFLWILYLPWLGLRCRWMGIRAAYIDESIPLVPVIARLFFGRRVAVTVADSFIDVYAREHPWLRAPGALIKWLDRIAWRRIPLIFTRARNTRDYLARQGVDPAKVHPVYDPCDMTVYRPVDRAMAREHFKLPSDAVVLVHHGILHPNKGNDRIIRALATHRDRFPKLIYLLIGDGPDMANLRKLVDELDLRDRVIFTGWLKTLEEVNLALNAGDIGLVMRVGHATDDFHMTGALVHSMACGLPILAARLAGVAEVVREGENGFLFDPHALSDFPEKLDLLYRDGELRVRMGVNSLRDAAENFDMQTVTKRTVSQLLRLTGLDDQRN